MITNFQLVNTKPFHEWYATVAEADAAMVWSKAKDYGSFTLTEEALRLLVSAGHNVPHLRLSVLALNATQKLNRIIEGLARGTWPDDDSWRDLACYAMIARRLRETAGEWPA